MDTRILLYPNYHRPASIFHDPGFLDTLCEIKCRDKFNRSFWDNVNDPSNEYIYNTPEPNDGLDRHVRHVLMRYRIRRFTSPTFVETWVQWWDFKEANRPNNIRKDHEIAHLANDMPHELFWHVQDIIDFRDYLVRTNGVDRIKLMTAAEVQNEEARQENALLQEWLTAFMEPDQTIPYYEYI